MRTLLNHIKGATSFDHLKIIGGRENGTFNDVCISMGLLESDMMWIEEDSKRLQTPRGLHTVVNIPGDQIPGC